MTDDAHEITRQSRSNLAFALAPLPRVRREDMISFYAFCRIVDDIADEPERQPAEKTQALDLWRDSAARGFACAEDPLKAELGAVVERYEIPPELFVEVIDGVASDIEPVLYQTYEELLAYCYRVASAVGLVSIRIFGCESPRSTEYAIQLGYALQITNILRDVGEDLENEGRIYLPLEDMERFGYSEDDLRARRYTPAFREMMELHHGRALGHFAAAAASIDSVDRPRLVASEMMGKIYREILEAMHADGFRVFDRRYRVSRPRKALILARAWLGAKFGARFPD